VAEIGVRGALDQPGLPGQGGGGPLERLSPGLLSRTDAMSPVLGHGWRPLLPLTHGRHLGGKRDGVIRCGVEPIRAPMRLSSHLIGKNARHCGC